jgi:hypothetical protein
MRTRRVKLKESIKRRWSSRFFVLHIYIDYLILSELFLYNSPRLQNIEIIIELTELESAKSSSVLIESPESESKEAIEPSSE